MAGDQTYEKFLTLADIEDRISIPAAVRDGLFPDVAENSKTDIRMVDEKGNSYDVVLTVRKNRTKAAFRAKGSNEFVNKRKLLHGDVLFFSQGEYPGRIKVRVHETWPTLHLAPPGSVHLASPPQPLAARLGPGLGSSVGSDHARAALAETAVGPGLSIRSEHALLKPQPKPNSKPKGALVLGVPAARLVDIFNELPVHAAPPAIVDPQARARVAGLISFGSLFEMGKESPDVLVGGFGHVLQEPTPPAALLERMAARGTGQPSSDMLGEQPAEHQKGRTKLFGVFI